LENKRLNVLFITKWYPHNEIPYDGIFVVDHAKAVSKYHTVFLLFVHSNQSLKEKYSFIFSNEHGYNELNVFFKASNTGISILDSIITAFRYIKYQFKGYHQIKTKWGKPNLVHLNVLLRASVLVLWLRWFQGIKFLITEHWTGYDEALHPKISFIRKKLIALVLKNSDVVTTVSTYLKNQIQKINNSPRFEVVSNCIDEEMFKPNENPERKVKELIHISGIDNAHKNFGELLNSIALLVKKTRDFRLVVYGQGVYNEMQIAKAKELNLLNTFVFFMGALPKIELSKKIAESDVMILYSNYETQSCVLLEAFMCGIPVIAPNIGGVNEIVVPHNGVLVQKNNNEDFSETLFKFVSGQLSFNKAEIRSNALKYGHVAIGKQFADIYSTILDKHEG
jgi:L-malate glycosyltransferase